jgi:hypothetical protein
MRSRNALVAAALLVMASGLAVANVWFAAMRSTIPLEVDAFTAGKEVRHEKHPPKDDVCLLDLRQYGVIHVDREVFERVQVNDRLRKSRWSGILLVNEKPVALEYSADTRGMVQVMPLACLILLVAATWACRIGGRASG